MKIVAEAVNREIAREYGISESMVRKWRNQQDILFSGELKITAKRASMAVTDQKIPNLINCWLTGSVIKGAKVQMPSYLIH